MLSLLAPAAREPNALDRALPTLTDQAQVLDVRLDIALAMLGLGLVALVWHSLGGKRPTLDPLTTKRANLALTIALVVAALASSVNYFYAERNNGVWLHRWDAFHTMMGAKYFDELGYFDLYSCSYAIDQAGPRHFKGVKEIRDLRTRKMVAADRLLAGNDCAQRFTPARLEQFRHDLDQFGKFSNPGMWKDLFKDKGFNGTPFYLWVTKTLSSQVSSQVDLESIRRLAYIDVVLMLLGFLAVGRAFGVRTAAIVAIYFCVDFPNRFEHMGGSILRFDYIAALLVGFSAIKLGRWGLAGGMFAWATMVRVFPAIFVAGLALKLALDWRETKQWLPEHIRFAVWFGSACAVMTLISLVGVEGGFANYQTWAEDMRVHTQTSAAYRIGFRHMFMVEGNLSSAEGFVNYAAKAKAFAKLEIWYWLAVVALLAPLVRAGRKLDLLTFACLFGVFGFFLVSIATRYYYSVLCLLLLVDRDLLKDRYAIGLGILLFAGSVVDFAYWQVNDYAAFMYNHVIGAQMTLTIVIAGICLVFDPTLIDRKTAEPARE